MTVRTSTERWWIGGSARFRRWNGGRSVGQLSIATNILAVYSLWKLWHVDGSCLSEEARLRPRLDDHQVAFKFGLPTGFQGLP